jgi:hypothetical protein
VLIGLLIYYFKGRITELEQKNMKCLELIGDVYKSHLELKRGIATIICREQVECVQQTTDPRIKIELQEQSQEDDFYEDEDEDEDEDDSDSDNSDDEDSIVEIIDNQIKTVNVDLSGSIELTEEIEVEDMEIEDVDAILKVEQSEPIIVNKVEIDGEIKLAVEWAKIEGAADIGTIYNRVRKGFTGRNAIENGRRSRRV